MTEDECTYAELALRLGLSDDDVRNRLRETRRRLRDIVRVQVQGYLAPGENVDEERAFVAGDP